MPLNASVSTGLRMIRVTYISNALLDRHGDLQWNDGGHGLGPVDVELARGSETEALLVGDQCLAHDLVGRVGPFEAHVVKFEELLAEVKVLEHHWTLIDRLGQRLSRELFSATYHKCALGNLFELIAHLGLDFF